MLPVDISLEAPLHLLHRLVMLSFYINFQALNFPFLPAFLTDELSDSVPDPYALLQTFPSLALPTVL